MYDPMTMLAEQHRRELTQAAEQLRLIEIARPNRKPIASLLQAMGRRMIVWGTRLAAEPCATQRLNSRKSDGDEPAISTVGQRRIVIEVR
ncbi:MAG: hypothetical protein KJ065_23505 [Anaerolineae bacterium]|nr:hypothetical protein [Anaerolineae bacterium]